ncbi:hypothetical protein GCM10009786_18220 [Leucobacter alluvii]|uniref:Uncharacterized protein n=1 Tax=Leucobacter alluvii TaxID=340321 RepID=A0ABP5MXP3_9MICO
MLRHRHPGMVLHRVVPPAQDRKIDDRRRPSTGSIMRVVDICPKRHDLTPRESTMLISRSQISEQFLRRSIPIDRQHGARRVIDRYPIPPAREPREQSRPIRSDHAVSGEHRGRGAVGAA